MVTPIPHSRATRIRLPSHIRSSRSRSAWIGLAFVLTGLLLASSLATLAAGPQAHATPSVSSDSVSVAGRVATLWPFSRDSIWNLPIGANAVYVPANIKKPTAYDAAGNQDATVISFRVNPEASSVFGFLQTLPLLFPLIALALLMFAVAFWRRRLRHNEAEDRGGFEHDDLPDEYESSEF